MSRIGPKELSATSLVGARIINSAEGRSFKINAVSIIAAAMVDFVFFLEINKKNSRINLRFRPGSYAPKIEATNSYTHSLVTSLINGGRGFPSSSSKSPTTSTNASCLKVFNARSATSGNSGLQGMSDSRLTILFSQSGHAVVQSGSIALINYTHKKTAFRRLI
ncbi:hypothetical protein J709_0295 [Acinetobacter baumannii 7893]|nr:hypothetical protein ACINNAV2_2840 [Acinetobacter baumannii Naval-2]EXD21830.1 hypothetical protein J480_3695 [Acinetobacter baumannii 34654]EXG71489.1 hypothetical protein J709_0295 [Acinetobacter baumannii 7893]EXH36409.1 hypothetical protein J629_3323 [Acinetobacter baumannii 1207552]KCW32439.1 hypothetical protein J474_0462 [Acinetobacter baumannii 6935]